MNPRRLLAVSGRLKRNAMLVAAAIVALTPRVRACGTAITVLLQSAVVAMSCLFAPLANATLFVYTSTWEGGYLRGTADVDYEPGVTTNYFFGEELKSFSLYFYNRVVDPETGEVATVHYSFDSLLAPGDVDLGGFMRIGPDWDVLEWQLGGGDITNPGCLFNECTGGEVVSGKHVFTTRIIDSQYYGSLPYDEYLEATGGRLGYDSNGVWTVPEPSSLALLGLAGVAMGWSQRRRRIRADALAQ